MCSTTDATPSRNEKHDFLSCSLFLPPFRCCSESWSMQRHTQCKPTDCFSFKLRHNNLSTSVQRWHLYLELHSQSIARARPTEEEKQKLLKNNEFQRLFRDNFLCVKRKCARIRVCYNEQTKKNTFHACAVPLTHAEEQWQK